MSEAKKVRLKTLNKYRESRRLSIKIGHPPKWITRAKLLGKPEKIPTLKNS